ncbi:MAG: carboxypeptidase regulatory-like domain-containing protein, partial [Acidobacteria bacterium]|nr:carboxypeptidase regulatory-like domain-containing protein [Acidobacteriota bacterium]
NLDPIFHNIFSLSKPKNFDLGNYPQNQSRSVTFAKPGVVFLNCHLHPNMSAAIVVTPNRWCARAGSDGKFRLPGLPPGKYTVVAWHKTAGLFRQEIVVRGGETTVPIQFLIPLAEASEEHPLARK